MDNPFLTFQNGRLFAIFAHTSFINKKYGFESFFLVFRLPPETGPPYQEPYGSEGAPNAPAGPAKAYEEESGGEFAGLASYFSSQREDDLDS